MNNYLQLNKVVMRRMIQQNKNGEIALKPEEKENDLNVDLVDEKGVSLANYSFDAKKLRDVDIINYKSSNVKISFNIDPTTTCELRPSPFA